MSSFPQLDAENATIKATIKTNMGDIKLALFKDQAPKTVDNFIGLSKEGKYDNVIFHRVINGFMIQGGDPTGTGMGGESIYGKSFEDEFSNELFNIRGALSMANAGPNTNGSQFCIGQAKNIPDEMFDQMKEAGYPEEIIEAYKEGGTPWLDHRHTVFGQVISGMDVVDKIAAVETTFGDKPKDDVVIVGVEIEE